MDTLGIISIILNAVFGGTIVVTLITLRSVKRKAAEEARSIAIDNDRKVSEMVNEYLVEPIKKEVTGLRREVSKLRRAIEKIPACPHSSECPVKAEMEENEEKE